MSRSLSDRIHDELAAYRLEEIDFDQAKARLEEIGLRPEAAARHLRLTPRGVRYARDDRRDQGGTACSPTAT